MSAESDLSLEEADAIWKQMFSKDATRCSLPDERAFADSTLTSTRVLLASERRGHTKASPIDLWEARFSRHFNWYFDSCPDVDVMRAALATTLCRYPELAARLRLAADASSPFVLFDHSHDDAGVSFQIRTLPHYWHERGLSAASEDELYDCVYADLECFQAPQLDNALLFPDNAELMNVLLTVFPKTTDHAPPAAVLSVGLQHAVADAHSAFAMTVAWAREARRLLHSAGEAADSGRITPDDRYTLLRAHCDFDSVQAPPSAERLAWLGWRLETLREMFARWTAIGGGPATARRLLVDEAVVEALKAFALSGSAGEQLRRGVLSTNDVMCALLLYGHALTRTDDDDDDDDDDVSLMIVVNSRSQLQRADYFGNAVVHLTVKLPAQRIVDMSFSELCLAVRQRVAGYDRPMVEQSLALFYSTVERQGRPAILTIGTQSFSCFVTNWAKFDVYGNDFGSGRPAFFLRKGLIVPGFYFVTPHPSRPNCSYWYLSLRPQVATWIDSISSQLSQPEKFLHH